MKKQANKKLLKALGKRIRDVRVVQKISQSQLAFECGVHRDQIGRIELGKQNTSIATIFSIADALNIEIKDLFEFKL